MEGQNDNIFLGMPNKKVPALNEQELSIFFLMDLFTQ
jgi:hypothetical protein